MSDFDLVELSDLIEGDLFSDNLHKIIYATDASVYREMPIGVVYPKNHSDLKNIVHFCGKNAISIIPRAGGTSLAGQCVGNGLVVDVSKYMREVISVDADAKIATVQPGVIRDELNHKLQSCGLMLGPNTSTANRAMIGGMVGNNSCGSTSIVFGSMRDHVQKIKAILSDGSEVTFEPITVAEFKQKCELETLEGSIYRHLKSSLSDINLQKMIKEEFPKSSIKRRNTGYALDAILNSEVFLDGHERINLCKLICGSEGTLAFISEITIGLVEIPPKNEVLVALQFDSVGSSLKAVPQIMNHAPFACELMDKTILDCTKGQRMYERDRFFLKGDPMAVLLVSFVHADMAQALIKVDMLIQSLNEAEFLFESTVVTENVDSIWNLRKAGLGLLANLPGDRKAVTCIEDTAVAIESLSAYIEEFDQMMQKYGQKSVYYAHAGAGEIHLRPILDLKYKKDRELFYNISHESAQLVKKYNGSLSGEHGDGRVRAPFIKDVYGEVIYSVFCDLKQVWDPNGILNPGKIVDAKPMTTDLRFDVEHREMEYDTTFDFSHTGGVLRASEKCNGSGDCRKLPLSGGTMCPSYMATRNEKDTTRARANTLREILTRPSSDNAWDSEELKQVMDLCLSCKGCLSECPSNVDMSAMKAEFQHQYHKVNGVSFRTKLFSNFANINSYLSRFSRVTNFLLSNKMIMGGLLKNIIGIHPKRSFPTISNRSLKRRYKHIKNGFQDNNSSQLKTVYLFIDEFTNYNDAEVGEKGLRLLLELGYNVEVVEHMESGRAAISKGLLDHAVKCANANVSIFHPLVSDEIPLIGIEPSAILTFLDEYPRLVNEQLRKKAAELSKNVFTIESFLYAEVQNGNISSSNFNQTTRKILLHGHCHQKALTDINEVAWLLSVPTNFSVEVIPSGCCGMAGSFGYEVEHFDVSMQIGELVLFPKIRQAPSSTTIAASGTSCRHQVLDGTGVAAEHVVVILYEALVAK